MTLKKMKNINLRGFRLFIASVSTGSIGQLAADILISSSNMEKYALEKKPILGPQALREDLKDISISNEFFVCKSNKIVLFKFGSPITAMYNNSLIDEIPSFVKSEEISEIVQLASANDYENYYVLNSPFEFVANDIFKVSENLTYNFKKSTNITIPGCGLAVKLHNLATIMKIPSLILIKYSKEDYNSDAMQLAEKFNNLGWT